MCLGGATSPISGLEMYRMRYQIFLFLAVLMLGSCRHHPTMREMGIVLDTLKAKGKKVYLLSNAQRGFTENELTDIMEQNRHDLNEMLPVYSRISAIEIRDEDHFLGSFIR